MNAATADDPTPKQMIRAIAGFGPAGEGIKAAMLRAADLLPDFSANRIKDIWYGDQRITVRPTEITILRMVYEAVRDGVPVALARAGDEEAGRHDLQEFRARGERLGRALDRATREDAPIAHGHRALDAPARDAPLRQDRGARETHRALAL